MSFFNRKSRKSVGTPPQFDEDLLEMGRTLASAYEIIQASTEATQTDKDKAKDTVASVAAEAVNIQKLRRGTPAQVEDAAKLLVLTENMVLPLSKMALIYAEGSNSQ